MIMSIVHFTDELLVKIMIRFIIILLSILSYPAHPSLSISSMLVVYSRCFGTPLSLSLFLSPSNPLLTERMVFLSFPRVSVQSVRSRSSWWGRTSHGSGPILTSFSISLSVQFVLAERALLCCSSRGFSRSCA